MSRVKTEFSWDIMSCQFVINYRYFGRTSCFQSKRRHTLEGFSFIGNTVETKTHAFFIKFLHSTFSVRFMIPQATDDPFQKD